VAVDSSFPYSSYLLRLADGTRYAIRAGDRPAERVVQAFAAAAQLTPPEHTAAERVVLAITCAEMAPPHPIRYAADSLMVCSLPSPTDADQLATAMTLLTEAIARDVQKRGGVLLHGALAAWPLGGTPRGVVFVAPGGLGKSTASRRLPPPWRALCDDTTLVVQDSAGHYYAHPTPTWSRFYSFSGAVGGTWDMQTAVPLHTIFFLSQATDDDVEPLESPSCTVALLAESAEQAGRLLARFLLPDEEQRLNRERLANVEALAQRVPAWRLHISLNGAFWEHVERVLIELGRAQAVAPRATRSTALRPRGAAREDAFFIVYTGASMNPTLAEPDVLEVLPYHGRMPRRGDIIYFVPPDAERGIVHRVTAVTPQGLRTRGDNNPSDDADLVQLPYVVGQVVAAHRGARRRVIPGGRWGELHRILAGLHNASWRLGTRLLHAPYHSIARAVAGHLSARLPLRVVRFAARCQTYDKLFLGRRLIGQYDRRAQRWIVRFPYRLLVDETVLPREL
jgi:SynChlorMet cassette protein ScmC